MKNILPCLVAIDVDGTLLNPYHEITQTTKESVRAIRKAGIDIILTSARGAGLMRKVVYELDLYEPCQFIAAQGALIGSFDSGGNLRTTYENTIPLPAAHKIVNLALRYEVSVNWFRGINWLANAIDNPIRHEALIVHELPLISCLATQTSEPHKLLLIDPSHSHTAAELIPIHNDSSRESFQIEISKPGYFEITKSGISKGSALKFICQRQGINPTDVVAIGDGFNDLSMFDFAGTSIAMENSPTEVRQHAMMVTLSNNEDGVARALLSILNRDKHIRRPSS